MSEWFALRPVPGTEVAAPGPKRATERRPPAESDPEASPTEDAPPDE
ncbi:hypothetical protein [Kribbella steppae]|nr:hypothetical protein [Kribbella steppae]